MYSKLDKDQREDSLGANLHRTANRACRVDLEIEAGDLPRLLAGAEV